VQVFEDKQNGSPPDRALKERTDSISHAKANRSIVRDGGSVEEAALTQLWQDEAEVRCTRRK
jgi:hypothetical protein